MKLIPGYLFLVLVFAFLGTAILFGLSYWMEVSLTQQWVADSTDLIKSDRQLKSIGLACLVSLVVCPISSLFLPKKYLHVHAGWYVGMFYVAYEFANLVVWYALKNMHLISAKDPFFLHRPLSGGPDPGIVQLESFLVALALTLPIFWWRRRSKST